MNISSKTLKLEQENSQISRQTEVIEVKDLRKENHLYDELYNSSKQEQSSHIGIHTANSPSALDRRNLFKMEDLECVICINCNKWFECTEHLENHERIVHKGERPLKCTHFDEVFAHQTSLKIHQESHIHHEVFQESYNDDIHIKNNTSQNFQDADLEEQQSVHSEGERAKDTNCENNVSETGTFCHDQCPEEEKPFKCTVCSKGFSRNSNLKSHFRTHSGERPYQCTICNKAFAVKSNLKNHLFIHNNEKPFKCSICNRAFRQKSQLKCHQQIHSEEKRFQCPTCGDNFRHKTQIQVHQQVHHGEKKPFECTVCKKTFSLKTNFQRHQQIHTGEKPFKCSICSREFSLKANLQRHHLIHTGEKPFKCTVCGKTFALNDGLKCHLRTHSGEKPFQCSICKKSYSIKANLKRHIQQLHS